MISLSFEQWQVLQKRHQDAVATYSVPFRERRRVGGSHPVNDFLFVYYRYSPAKLEQWHPGIGIKLELNEQGDFPLQSAHGYVVSKDGFSVQCDASLLNEKEKARIQWTIELLEKTAGRRANFSCLGLHEWAMVYGGNEVRHEKSTELRLPQAEIDQLVESRPITCSHFDAFRFFDEKAKPLNRLTPTLEERPQFEQPACIHANMDLYKWAFKSMPWVGSELLFKCFELAIFAREIDMRASPYDLSKYGDYEPIRIETAEGRLQYEKCQREVYERAQPVRQELMEKLSAVLRKAASTQS